MGCDIHFYVESEDNNGKWRLESPPINEGSAFYCEWRKQCEGIYKEDGIIIEEFDVEDGVLGCWDVDIHKTLKSPPNGMYIRIDDWNVSRSYGLFSILANVRGEHDYGLGDPRGMPDDACDALRVYGEDYDWHSHSHCLVGEAIDLFESGTIRDDKDWDYYKWFYTCLLEIESHVGKPRHEIRLVFWFDN